MQKLMNLSQKPDGVIIMDDSMCMGAMRYLEEIKVSIPQDIAVACFNDSAFNRFSKPSITAVTVDSYQLGMSAAETLLAVLNNKDVEYDCKYIDYEIIVRESTRQFKNSYIPDVFTIDSDCYKPLSISLFNGLVCSYSI